MKNEKQYYVQELAHLSRIISAGATGRWIPQYTLTHQGAKNQESDVATHHAQLKTSFWNENEADEFALQDAMHWIDRNDRSRAVSRR
ncbi:MAG: hypothetical protein ACREQ2_22275 [Candidatus Binatia bacterium]